MSTGCGATDADGAVSEKDTPTGEKNKRTTTGVNEMKWEDLYKDWGFILLMLIIVMLWSYLAASCGLQ